MLSVMMLLRYCVFAVVAVAVVTGFAAMAVQRRLLNPFGRLARAIRGFSDPLIKPIERRVLRSGGNPQQAPWWMVGITVLAGIALISAADWVSGEVRLLGMASSMGPGLVVHVVLGWIIALLKLALIVRVIGSWFGIGDWAPWMRPFYYLTEWFLGPLRRVLPNVGPLDISPIVAWLILSLIGSRV